MPTATAQADYAYLLKTTAQMRRRVQRVQERYDISFNAALKLLLTEALDARGINIEDS